MPVSVTQPHSSLQQPWFLSKAEDDSSYSFSSARGTRLITLALERLCYPAAPLPQELCPSATGPPLSSETLAPAKQDPLLRYLSFNSTGPSSKLLIFFLFCFQIVIFPTFSLYFPYLWVKAASYKCYVCDILEFTLLQITT